MFKSFYQSLFLNTYFDVKAYQTILLNHYKSVYYFIMSLEHFYIKFIVKNFSFINFNIQVLLEQFFNDFFLKFPKIIHQKIIFKHLIITITKFKILYL